MSWPNSERSGAPLYVPVIFLASTSTHDGKPTFSASCSESWMRSWPFDLSATETTSPALQRRRRHVQRLPLTTIAQCVTSWRASARVAAEAHPVDDVVEARLEELQQVGAGRALAASGLGEVAAELALEQAVHAAQLLLLAQLVAEVGLAHAGLHARADRAWFPACTWSRAIDARFSGKGRCLPVAPACIWVRCSEPCAILSVQRNRSDATALRRAAAVVRHRRHVGDARDLHAERVQCAHGRLAAGAGALDAHLEVLHAALLRRAAGRFRRHLRRERRRLARALEAGAARRRPRQGVALAVDLSEFCWASMSFG